MEGKTLYFDSSGKHNTDDTLGAVRQRAQELGIDQVVVASTHGYTARRAKEVLGDDDIDIIAVSICAGFDDQGWTMTSQERQALEDLGIIVVTTMHALGDDVSDALGFVAPNKVVRETLYRFSQGMKVAVEVAMMAADAGVLDMDREIIAVGGTGAGADTAVVLKPAYARKFNELEIREVLAKPRQAS